MKKYVAVSPISIRDITEGKEYAILRFRNYTDAFGRSFYIIEDNGDEAYCLELECEVINRHSWRIKEVQ